MPRLPAIRPDHAAGRAKELLDGVQATLGMVRNLMRTMANAPAVLEAYLHFEGALAVHSLRSLSRSEDALPCLPPSLPVFRTDRRPVSPAPTGPLCMKSRAPAKRFFVISVTFVARFEPPIPQVVDQRQLGTHA